MSQAIADQLPDADVVVIHETVDGTEFSPAKAGRFRAAAGIPDDVPLVGAAGRIDTWKGFDVLLDAFPRVRERCPDAHLVIAGGPVEGKETYAAALRVVAATRADTHWLGPRTDVPEILADLDVFVMASTEPEPYGLVAVEALASGVPVVMTDAGGPQGDRRARPRPGPPGSCPSATPTRSPTASWPRWRTAAPAPRRPGPTRPVLREPESPDRFADGVPQRSDVPRRNGCGDGPARAIGATRSSANSGGY